MPLETIHFISLFDEGAKASLKQKTYIGQIWSEDIDASELPLFLIIDITSAMNQDNAAIASSLVSPAYITQGMQAIVRRQKLIKTLLSQRRLPSTGWDEATIEMLLKDSALMDSNNFLDNVGMGEREGRVVSDLVARRHFRMVHGIGRSGDIAAEQPKAAGSSLLARLTNELVSDALKIAGILELGPVLTLPLATGMALTTTLLALRGLRPSTARYVIWPRIDQKTCLKCIPAAGFEPIVVNMKIKGDQIVTDINAIETIVDKIGCDAVACVMTTTSCFAPRVPDDVVSVAKICKNKGIPHIINNAYGVQSKHICSMITSACRKGRVDGIVQSTDKNFMVPVGGSVVASPKSHPELTKKVNSLYPGRASMSPLLDLLITLLEMGEYGWKEKLKAREQLKCYAYEALQKTASALGERVLKTDDNPISMAMTVNSLLESNHKIKYLRNEEINKPERSLQAKIEPDIETSGDKPGEIKCIEEAPNRLNLKLESPTFLGSMLFSRAASGSRVFVPGKSQEVAGIKFNSYGASSDEYKDAYINVAAAIGGSSAEVDEFLRRLEKCVAEFRKLRQ